MKAKLKEVYLFKDLCDETLERIAEFTSFLKLSKDNVLFYEGEESKYLYLLKKSSVCSHKYFAILSFESKTTCNETRFSRFLIFFISEV